MAIYSGLGINVKFNYKLNIQEKKYKCYKKDPKEQSACKHFINGQCKSNIHYHYCKHIVGLKNKTHENVLIDLNFSKNFAFNFLENVDRTLSNYKGSLKDYFNKANYVFPQFQKNHTRGDYIPLAFTKKIDISAPILIAGKESNQRHLNFSSFYIADNYLSHFNFFLAYINYFGLYKDKDYKINQLFALEKETELTTNRNIVLAVFDNNFYVLDRSNRLKAAIEYFKIVKDNQDPKSGEFYEALNILNMLQNNTVDTTVNKVEIINKFSTRVDSMFNEIDMIKLNNEGNQTSEVTSILLEYHIFYSLLQLKASDNKVNNQTIIDKINKFKSTSTLFKPLIDEFLSA
jgi:hypothetical protein